jgi:putative alpha-1,2-mannosidase
MLILSLVVVVILLDQVDQGPFNLLPARYNTLRGKGARAILDHVDPLIGTTNGGHVFPGASLPYGMAKPVADTESDAENAAGFVSDDAPVLGFSHMHDSGTGGVSELSQA